MSKLRIGSLFSGVGALDLAVEEVFDAETVWQVEFDQSAATVLDKRFGVPNYRDVTTVDWAEVPPVDILCGGFPCQDVSAAGRKAGIADGTRSGLWAYFAEAIDVLRPQYVIIENVRGLLSAKAHRTGDLGYLDADVVLRAGGAVVGDLADIGYDARWTTLAAGAVGAPHKRERVFILAHPAGAGREGPQPLQGWRLGSPRCCRSAAHTRPGSGGDDLVTTVCKAIRGGLDWGKYQPAIGRWEGLTRPAPHPVEPNTKGEPRLSARFAEWMMGWPEGWVTDLINPEPRRKVEGTVSRSAALKMVGNGVVPQQAAAALRLLKDSLDNERKGSK